jgi:tRNA A-37 threonylcarbamoyl transferase component Bud32
MKAGNLHIINNYLGLLKSLPADSKLEIISKLSDSLKSTKRSTGRSLKSLYGAFRSEKSADQIISEIKEARTFNRKIESL